MQQEHRQEQALREDTGNQHPHRTLLERDKRPTKIDNMVWYRELWTTTDEVSLEMCTIDLNCLGLCPLFGGKEFQLTEKKTEIMLRNLTIYYLKHYKLPAACLSERFRNVKTKHNNQ